MSSSFYTTKIDKYNFTIIEENNYIVGITLDNKISGTYNKTPLITKTIEELGEYFRGTRKTFDIPINPHGTSFQKKVWMMMKQIPYGKTLSYGELARSINNPRSCRAIGGACHKNPILIIIPCHRVVAKNGLGGFGCGIDMKKDLLKKEGNL